MVTGSHIPADRNGLKFYRPDGEIDKDDERAIANAWRDADDGGEPAKAVADLEAGEDYVRRMLDFVPAGALAGLRVGLWAHSSVAAPFLGRTLEVLGCMVVPVGDSHAFLALDTEALGEAEATMLHDLVKALGLDALVSTDPDGDRPLVVDENGAMVPGDLLGAAVARHLGIRRLVTPVSTNSGLVEGADFDRVRRTRIGSPYVLAALAEEAAAGAGPVAGFEANGGFILAGDLLRGGRTLKALPTRDALLPIVAVLEAAHGIGLSRLTASLGFRAKRSTRIEHVAQAASAALIATTEREADAGAVGGLGRVAGIDRTDGLRLALDGGRIVHLRPSGNAPELRIYVEAGDAAQANELEGQALEFARSRLGRGELA